MKKMDLQVGRMCYIAPYRDILQQYGVQVSEELLLGISSGLVFEYSYIHQNQQVSNPLSQDDWISIVGSNSKIGSAVSDVFGVEFTEYEFGNLTTGLEVCKRELEAGRYAILFADVFYFPYHPQYQKEHGQTNIVLYEWDSVQQRFYFTDSHVTSIPLSTSQGYLTEEDLSQALIYNYSGKGLMFLTRQEEVKMGWQTEVKGAILNNVKQMLSEDSEYKGVKGIFRLAQEMEGWLNVWDVSSIGQVYRQGYFHVTGRGGPAISRKVYADFISEYLKIQASAQQVQTIARGFVEVSKLWNTLGAQFFRGSVKPTASSLPKLAQTLRQIGGQEKALFEQLLELLD